MATKNETTSRLIFRNYTFVMSNEEKIQFKYLIRIGHLTLNLPTTTIVAQPFNVIKWQLKFNPVA